MTYFVIEHQKRDDGNVNVSETGRSSLASGISLYHERYSKMLLNTEFPSVSIMLVDENLTVIEQENIITQYQPKAGE